MLTFKQFLKEQEEKTFVFTFGRYSPPTVGHIAHFKAVKQFAESNGFDYTIFVSKTQDNKKNPVPLDEKIAYIKKAIPTIHISPAVNMFSVIDELAEGGKYKKAIYFAGGDYFDDPKEKMLFTRLSQYAEEKGITLSVGNSGDRTPGISGTALRQAVLNNDFDTFMAASPYGEGDIGRDDVVRMYKIVKQNLQHR